MGMEEDVAKSYLRGVNDEEALEKLLVALWGEGDPRLRQFRRRYLRCVPGKQEAAKGVWV